MDETTAKLNTDHAGVGGGEAFSKQKQGAGSHQHPICVSHMLVACCSTPTRAGVTQAPSLPQPRRSQCCGLTLWHREHL